MTNKPLTMGVIGTSSKENEYRLPIHPEHLPLLDADLKDRIFIQEGYGSKFGTKKAYLQKHTGGVMSREDLFATCDIILLPKPMPADFPYLKEGQILWGWPHCVQGQAITQTAIDKKLTLIAWETMNMWRGDMVTLHIFHKNNELAGYCSILHSLALAGITGHYGPSKKVAIISFGATARGAVHALKGRGYSDISVFTHRDYQAVQNQIPDLNYYKFEEDDADQAWVLPDLLGERQLAMSEVLAKFDIIVNCIFQDTDNPVMFIENKDLKLFKPGTLIVDVSCDYKLGFDFARPTSFKDPTFEVGDGITYYAVDHTPSYLWNAATYEISTALISYIPTVMAGTQAWHTDETIKRAIEIENGLIKNEKILSFQNRENTYPYLVRDT